MPQSEPGVQDADADLYSDDEDMQVDMPAPVAASAAAKQQLLAPDRLPVSKGAAAPAKRSRNAPEPVSSAAAVRGGGAAEARGIAGDEAGPSAGPSAMEEGVEEEEQHAGQQQTQEQQQQGGDASAEEDRPGGRRRRVGKRGRREVRKT